MIEIDNVWSNTLETEFSQIRDLLTGILKPQEYITEENIFTSIVE